MYLPPDNFFEMKSPFYQESFKKMSKNSQTWPQTKILRPQKDLSRSRPSDTIFRFIKKFEATQENKR